MNVLVINGSPKGGGSNTMQLTRAFLRGIGKADIRQVDLCKLNISSCRGCFACWNKTPGECVISDDMKNVIENELWADLIVWSFPLYYFGVPGIMKNMIDRQLPMVLPFMTERTDGTGCGNHPVRYDMSGKRHMLISTCGFYSAEKNYDGIMAMFDHMLGKNNYGRIFCGQGELFRVSELKNRTDEYLQIVEKSGAEFASGTISDSTMQQLSELLYPKDVFEKMADASWSIEKETGEKSDASYSFTKQMAALYRKEAWDGDRVLEMHYTDIDKTYQIALGRDGSKVYLDGSRNATTRIDTPFTIWQQIARGEISGEQALGEHLYTVTGDFSLMIHWDEFFGGATSSTQKDDGKEKWKKNPSMLTMLIPWIVFWIAVSISPTFGAVITLGVCVYVPLIMRKRNFVIWDYLSMAAVSLLSLAAYFMENGDFATNIGYLVFGLFWLLSCFSKEPLCATYVKYNYGERKALHNPIFMRTNYILAAAWGILYIFTAVWTFMFRRAGLGSLLMIMNNLVPIVMGIFTGWFEKWYPAWKASGK